MDFDLICLIKYLSDGYNALHTQGESCLLQDIDEFLKIRGYESEYKEEYWNINTSDL